MSQQTIKKLTRLLEIERAKVEAYRAESEKWFRAYSDALGDKVIYKIRCEQAIEILAGEK